MKQKNNKLSKSEEIARITEILTSETFVKKGEIDFTAFTRQIVVLKNTLPQIEQVIHSLYEYGY